jgi:hypothetical protein
VCARVRRLRAARGVQAASRPAPERGPYTPHPAFATDPLCSRSGAACAGTARTCLRHICDANISVCLHASARRGLVPDPEASRGVLTALYGALTTRCLTLRRTRASRMRLAADEVLAAGHASTMPLAEFPPARRGALKKRKVSCLQIRPDDDRLDDDDALSSASTPPPRADGASAERVPWVSCKRPCAPGSRRVLINSEADVRYIAGLTRLADEQRRDAAGAWGRSARAPSDAAADDESGPPDGVEATKFGDGPAPEAVVVEKLVGAVTSTCETTAVCPILKALVRTGARDLLERVHKRLVCMGDRVSERGRVSVMPSSAQLGKESAPLLCFLRESVGRSMALVDKFQDPALSAPADSAGLTQDQRCTAAAMALILSKCESH